MVSVRQAPFGRVITAMATPFDQSGDVDLKAAAELANYLVANGSDALVVTGTTGESPALRDEERIEMWKTVREAVSVPVIAGSTTSDTAHSVELCRAAEKSGADAILAVTPYYSRPSQVGLFAHFSSIAEGTGLPVLLYDIPSRTGRKLSTETMVRLAEIDSIVGVKDAAGSPSETARLLRDAPETFCCYSGDDSLTLPLLSIGAVGLIGVATHWVGNEAREMIGSFLAGDVDRAGAINAALIESFTFETSEEAPNPIPTKAMMRVLGQRVGECRPPLGPAPKGLEESARGVLAHLEEFRVRGITGA